MKFINGFNLKYLITFQINKDYVYYLFNRDYYAIKILFKALF